MLLLFVRALLGSTAPAAAYRTAPADTLSAHLPDTLQPATADQPDAPAPLDLKPEPLSRRERRERARAAREQERRNREFNNLTQEERDSVFSSQVDSLVAQKADSLASRSDSDTTRNPRAARPFLDDQLSGKNTDSLVYDVRNKRVYVYNEGDVTYQNRNLKADYMQIDMDTKLIYAYGKPDSVDGKWTVTKPEFTEGGTAYQMDTITYNLDTQKAKIKGVATQQGDGWLVGGSVKKMPDNTFNIEHGKYTTCDQTDHPHFYLAMTKAKVIPGKKVVTGPAYLVMEDVPIYFLGIPEGFFPINMGPKSGLLMPTYGEETSKGFFLRDLGYYITLGEYADLALRGGFYTLGSWEASAASRYIKRYKYSGSFNVEFSSVKTGEKGEPDYIKQNNFRVQWTHSQDAKANPGSTFSASVNFATSGYNRYSATNINDILSTQTNSSISYSKSWSGTPFSLSANMAISQNSQNKSISVTLPTVVFNVSRFYPFKRKEKTGKDRWYEKISMQYTGKMTNSVTTTESEIFSKKTLENMKNGIEHSIPVSASFNLLNYINITPSFNYTEKWYFKKQEYEWNPITNQTDTLPSNYGFYRLYNYSTSVSASTTLYGMYDFTKKRRDRKIQAIRHTITPSVGFSYTPDFADPRYGYYLTRQTDSTGRVTTYSPYAVNAYGVPSSGRSMSMTFSLSQNLEMKVLSKRDTSGVKKIKLIDELRLGGSYNFLADSMRLSTISLSFRTLQELRHQPLGHDRPLPRHTRGCPLRQALLPGTHHLDGLVVRLHLQVARGQVAAGRKRHHEPAPGVFEPVLRPLRHDGPHPAKAIHVTGLLRLLAAVELRLQLCGELFGLLREQRHDGIPQERHADRQLQRLAEPHTQDGHHLPGRLRHQGPKAHDLVGIDHARPPLLADVLLVDPLRLPQELELQHRREGRLALRPEVRQVAVDVRQHVLTRSVLHPATPHSKKNPASENSDTGQTVLYPPCVLRAERDQRFRPSATDSGSCRYLNTRAKTTPTSRA